MDKAQQPTKLVKPITRRQALKYGFFGGVAGALIIPRLLSWANTKIFPSFVPKFEVNIWSQDAAENPDKYFSSGNCTGSREYERTLEALKMDRTNLSIGYQVMDGEVTEIDFNGLKKLDDFPTFIPLNLDDKKERKLELDFYVHKQNGTVDSITARPILLSKRQILEKIIANYGRDNSHSEEGFSFPRTALIWGQSDGIDYNIYGPEALTRMTPQEFNQYWIARTKAP